VIPEDYNPLDTNIEHQPAKPAPPAAPPRRPPAPPARPEYRQSADPPPPPREAPPLKVPQRPAPAAPQRAAPSPAVAPPKPKASPAPAAAVRPAPARPSPPQPPPAPARAAASPPPAPPRPSAAPPASAPAAGRLDFAALLAAAGLEGVQVTPELAASFGSILKTVVDGLRDVLRAREELKDQFRLRITNYAPKENNPIKFAANTEDALHNLLVRRNSAYLEPVAAFEGAFDDLRIHEMAMLAGMRAGYEAMLATFIRTHSSRSLNGKGSAADCSAGRRSSAIGSSIGMCSRI